MSEYKFVADNIHRKVPMEKPTIECSVCGSVVDTFYVGWNMSEYDANSYVCENFDCWENICLDSGYNNSPDYDDYDNQEDWLDAVEEEMWNEYEIKEKKKCG